MPWDAQPADRKKLIESFDTFAPLRNRLHLMAGKVAEYAGIPVPIDGEELVIEPSYEFAAALTKKAEPRDLDDGAKLRNTFYSTKHRCDIHVYEKDGRVDWAITPAIHHFAYDLRTLGCSFAWGIEQESRAINLLATLVGHVAFKQYLLTGMFIERSKRSGKVYVFRKLKPTVVLRHDEELDEMMLVCTLCMHPIAHYARSWAGAMCPTDDVIAHLMLMRGDEPMFWKRANHHAPHRPEAGL